MKISSILLESQNYHEMFNRFQPLRVDPILWGIIDAEIAFCREVLKNKERSHWYLKFIRSALSVSIEQTLHELKDTPQSQGNIHLPEGEYLTYLRSAIPTMEQISPYTDLKVTDVPAYPVSGNRRIGSPFYIGEVSRLKNHLRHYMGVASSSPLVAQVKFGNKEAYQLINELDVAEKEWQKHQGERLQVLQPNKGRIVLDCGDGWAWWDLEEGYCPDEATAMGHCGNQYGEHGDTILSLRKKVKGGYRPSLTFILNDGALGEMKGRANEKPNAKYHPQIVKLLMSDLVHSIKGGGHAPESNFAMADLPEEEREAIFEKKPSLMTVMDQYAREGLSEALQGRIEEETQHVFGVGELKFRPEAKPPYAAFKTKKRNETGIGEKYTSLEELVFEYWDGYKEVEEAKEALNRDDGYSVYTDHNTWQWMEHLPQAYIDKIMEVVEAEHKDDFLDEYDEDDLDGESQCLKFWSENLDDENVTYMAYETGVESARVDSILDSMRTEAQALLTLVIEEHDGGWELGIKVDELLKFCELPEEEQSDVYHSNFHEDFSITVRGHDGFDDDAALQTYIEYGDDDYLPEVPFMPDVESMTMEDICKEAERTEEDFRENMARYAYKKDDLLSYSRDILKRQRKRHWGVEKSADPVTESVIMEAAMTEVITARSNTRDADFWLIRLGTDEVVGKPVREYRPEHIGIKVKRGVSAEHMFFYFQSLHLTNQLAELSTKVGERSYILRPQDIRGIDFNE